MYTAEEALKLVSLEDTLDKEITIEEALKLVSFMQDCCGEWKIKDVFGYVYGDVCRGVRGDVKGNVHGSVNGYVVGDIGGGVGGDVCGHIGGTVEGNIESDEWQRVETPPQKLKRLIEEGADKKRLLEAFNQMEDNN